MSELLTFENYHGDMERVVAIEYHPFQGSMLPFSAFSTDNQNPTDYLHCYDMEWCKRDSVLYYHCSGSGTGFYIHPLCFPNKKPRCAIWWDRGIVSPTNGGNCSHRKLSDRTVSKFGYGILNEPLVLSTGTRNPFEFGQHGDTEYCSKCDDHLQSDDTDAPCKHLWWCEKCGDWSKPGERCKHRKNQ